MKIAIFDPSGSHGHYAHTQSIVFENENIEWFIHGNIIHRLRDLGVFKSNSNNVHTYSHRVSKIIFYLKSIHCINHKKWDIVFFNTLQSDWLLNLIFFLFVKKSTNIVLTVHNIHSFFANGRKVNLGTFIKRKTKQWALKKSKLNVYGENLKKCLYQYQPDAKVFLLPYKVYVPLENTFNNETKKIKIVIPGTVDLKRRNYKMVLDVVKNTSDLKDIQFVLLGKPVGAGSKELISELEKFKDSVMCYNDFVNEDEFERHMLSADIIWGPLHKYFETDDAIEEYGVSKETGISFAIIRYALPGILPSQIRVMDEIKSGIITYSNLEELTSIIRNLSAHRNSLQQLKEKALINSESFEVKKIKKQFIEQMFR